MAKKIFKTTDDYIESFPAEYKLIIKDVREIFHITLPEAEETISYQIPTYKINGKNIVHFAVYKNHLAIYPGPKAIEVFKDELIGYDTSKGAIKFPFDRRLPVDLIRRVLVYCVERFRI